MNNFTKKIEKIISGKNLSSSIYALKTKTDKIMATKIELGNENLASFLKSSLLYLLSKKYGKLQLKEYPFGIPKDHIEYVSLAEDVEGENTPVKQIKFKISELENAILNPETNDIDIKNYTSYVIVCSIENEKIYFITNKRLLKNFGKKQAIFIMFSDSQYNLLNKSFVNLAYHFDSIISKETCYFITLDSEEMFGLDRYCHKKTTQCKEELTKLKIATINDIKSIELFLKKPGHYALLKNYNKKTLEDLSKVTNTTKDKFEEKYRLNFIQSIDGSYKVDLSDEQKIRDFINTITNKRGLNFDNEVVESSSPLKICK